MLDEIVADTRVGVEHRRQRRSLDDVIADGRSRLTSFGPPRSLRAALRAADGVGLIAEHKRRSPSAGLIRGDLTLADVIGAYERGGATALSILTEETRFGGSLGDLVEARALTRLPILRKDFVIDSYQVHEALAAGADAVLLIVAALADDELQGLLELAQRFGLDVLVEVHDAAELRRAADLGASLIGINNRDLRTLEVDVRRTVELLPEVPSGAVVVAESGLRTRAQLDELGLAGVDGALIGEALMRAADLELACRALTGPYD